MSFQYLLPPLLPCAYLSMWPLLINLIPRSTTLSVSFQHIGIPWSVPHTSLLLLQTQARCSVLWHLWQHLPLRAEFATYELQTLKFLVLFTDDFFAGYSVQLAKKYVLEMRYYDCRHGSGHVTVVLFSSCVKAGKLRPPSLCGNRVNFKIG